MYFATKSRSMQVLAWLMWAVVCVVSVYAPDQRIVNENGSTSPPVLLGVVAHEGGGGSLVPWWPKRRLRKWAWKRYCTLRRAYRRAVWAARLAKLVLAGALTMAQVVDWLTRSQLRLHLGALPVLYALLEGTAGA